MPVEVAEHIFLMPASCLSLTNTRQDQHANKLLRHYRQEFADTSVRRSEQKVFL